MKIKYIIAATAAMLFLSVNVGMASQTMISFDEYQVGTLLDDEYANLGVLFSTDISPYATLQGDWSLTTVGVWENVIVTFVVPGDTTQPATTDFFQVEVNDIDRPFDTAPYIKAFDLNGVFLGEMHAVSPPNGGTKIQTLTVTFPKMHELQLYHEADGANGWDNFVFNTPIGESIQASIDIKPGSYPNSFNNNENGVIPVAVLGTIDFDVREINPDTVRLKGLAVKAVGKGNKLLAHYEDVNGDSYEDLVVQIEDSDKVFPEGCTIAELSGNLNDGTPGTLFEGTDEICIVP